MYNEKSFKRMLFGIKAKRVFFMLLFSIIGCGIGVIISSYLIDILLFDINLRPIIIATSTISFFLLSLLVTSNTNKNIQDGYWKIAVLRKLTVISKKMDSLQNLDNLSKLNNLDNLELLLENLKKYDSNKEEHVEEKNESNSEPDTPIEKEEPVNVQIDINEFLENTAETENKEKAIEN